MVKNGDMVLLLLLVLVAGLQCCIQARPEPVTGISDSNAPSNFTIFTINGTSTGIPIPSNSTFGTEGFSSWESFMTDLVNKYRSLYHSNVIIYKTRDEPVFGKGTRTYKLSERTVYPPYVLVDNSARICNTIGVCWDYRILAFNSPAYFETTGWYGYENWAFGGQIYHVLRTDKVTFFRCC